MNRPCEPRHPQPVPNECDYCYLFETSPKYRQLWGGDPRQVRSLPLPPWRGGGPGIVAATPVKPADPVPCVHRSERLPLAQANALGLGTAKNYYKCAKGHGHKQGYVCTCSGCGPGCRDYAPDPDEIDGRPEPPRRPPITTRHLLYHLYPVAGNGAWQQCVDELVKRIELFNGKIVVAIVTDPPTGRKPDPTGMGAPCAADQRNMDRCDSTAAVRERFGRFADRIEFLELENDPHQRELVSLFPMLERLPRTDSTHATLYAQSKGVTYRTGHVCHRWARTVEETYLDYWPLVQDILRRHPLAGSFLKEGNGWPHFQSQSTWHYSGSWFWFRNAELFARDWRKADRFWSGIEPYPSLHFGLFEAGAIFHRGPVPQVNLYDAQYWHSTVDPALSQFRAANAGRRVVVPPGLPRQLNVGCGPHYQPGWLNIDIYSSELTKPDVIVPTTGPLPFPDGHFDRVYNGHFLEHIDWERVPAALAELRRVIKPGGLICSVAPDVKRAMDRVRANPCDETVKHFWECAEEAMHFQYEITDQDHKGARHCFNMYEARLVAALKKSGFVDVRPVPVTPDELAGWPVMDFWGAQCAAIGRAP